MKRFKNILYFADGQDHGSTGLQRAVTLAKANEARLTVVDVLSESDCPPGIEKRFGIDLDQMLCERREAALEEMVAPHLDEQTMIYTRVMSGKPFIEVIRAILRNGHDLLIKDARPSGGFSGRLLGSTDLHLLRKCPCPVWIDRPQARLPYRAILAAVNPMEEDGQGCARLVLELSSSLARLESAHLAVVHAWELYGESMLRSGHASLPPDKFETVLRDTRRAHATQLDDLLRPYGMSTEDTAVHLCKGEPVKTINDLRESLEADLIVMGTVGRAGISGFFIGNTAEEVLQTTRASILAVKPAGFVSPVTLE